MKRNRRGPSGVEGIAARGPLRRPAGVPGRASRRGLAGCGLISLALSLSCLFSTRTPETPLVNEVPWVDPLTPAKALTNVKVTFQAKSVGNYDRSLASDFTFVPSDADRAFMTASGEAPTYFDEWTKTLEVQAFTSIFYQLAGTVTFSWDPSDPTAEEMLNDDADPGGGKYFENLAYRMVFKQSAAVDTVFSGRVNLYLREQTGGWIIYRWVDQQDGSPNSTLGLVRWKKKIWE